MYYLRKIEEDADRAIYKATDVPRFYRQHFRGIDAKIPCMKLYTCKTMKKILELRNATFNYCGEWFDVYDENGKVELAEEDNREKAKVYLDWLIASAEGISKKGE